MEPYEKIFHMNGISEHAKILYIYLSVCRSASRTEMIVNFSSYQSIADACSISRRTAFRAIKELIQAGLLERNEQVNQYTICEYLESATQSPESATQSLGSATQSPESATQSLESATQSPESATQSPESATQSPESATQSLGSATQSPESATQSLGSAAQLPESATQSPESATQSLGSATQSLESATQSPESATQSLGSATQSLESATQSPESATQSPESATQSPEGAAQSPESDTQSPGSDTQSLKGKRRRKERIKDIYSPSLLTSPRHQPLATIQDEPEELVRLVEKVYQSVLEGKSNEISIGGEKLLREKVQAIYLSLEEEHFRQVIEYIKNNKVAKINAIKTALYNAPEYVMLGKYGDQKTGTGNGGKIANQFNNFHQRSYDYQELEKKLLAK